LPEDKDELENPDRRRSRRVSSSVRCWIRSQSCAFYTPIRDINREGLSVAGPVPFREGEEISIRIEGNVRGSELVARSRVIWTRAPGPDASAGMGAEFLEIRSGGQLLDRILGEGDPK
jgi:hypothetical protein